MPRPGLLPTTFAVAARELKESLREIHVLLFTLGFPLVFYPLMFWAGIQLALLDEGLSERNPPRVFVEGPPDLVETVTGAPFVRVESEAPKVDLDADELDLIVRGKEEGDALSVRVRYLSTRPRSEEAKKPLLERLDDLREERRAGLEERLELEEGALAPAEIRVEDEAPPGRTLASLLGMAVPMVLLTSMMLAGVYPTVEIAVGERERGTLETTMVAASPRRAIIAGKVLAIVALVLLSTLGNALAMGLTIIHIQEQMDPSGGSELALSWGDLLLATPVLLVTAVLAAAFLTLAALPTRSFRQGQSATSTAATVLMLPALIGVMPEVDLTPGTALIPVGNAVLVLREAIGGDGLPGLPTLVALCLNAGLAGGALLVAAKVVGAEGWLFGGHLPGWMRFFYRDRE